MFVINNGVIISAISFSFLFFGRGLAPNGFHALIKCIYSNEQKLQPATKNDNKNCQTAAVAVSVAVEVAVAVAVTAP